MEWYEELGFYENPFTTQVLKTDFDYVGREKEVEEVMYRIESGNVTVIEGPKGSGKTALLNEIIKEYGGEKRILYMNSENIGDNYDFEKLIKKKGMILLLDDLEFLSNRASERIKHFYDEDMIRSIVFATRSYEDCRIPESLRQRIGRNVIDLENPDLDVAYSAVQDRLQDEKDMLPKPVIEKIHNNADDFKHFLWIADKVCKQVLERDGKQASKKDVEKVLGGNQQ